MPVVPASPSGRPEAAAGWRTDLLLRAAKATAQLSMWPYAPCVPPKRHDHDQDAHKCTENAQRAQAPARRNLRNEKVSLTTTLITKLLTNPLAQSRSTEDAEDQSPGLGQVHQTGRLSMAWKRSALEASTWWVGYRDPA